jgi:hypothetical protein
VIGFDDEAWDAIQVLFDDPQRATLAERLDEMLDLLEKDSGDQRVRRHRLQLPRQWLSRSPATARPGASSGKPMTRESRTSSSQAADSSAEDPFPSILSL